MTSTSSRIDGQPCLVEQQLNPSLSPRPLASPSYPRSPPFSIMEIELLPTVSLLPETFSVLVSPVELMTGALNSHLELQRYKILFISGNYSRILSRLNRNITELDVRRAFTVFQLMTILQENHHSFLIVEHDPLLYENVEKRMVEYLAQALKQASREATVLLYAPALDPQLQKLTELADRVFCIYGEQAPAKGRAKAEAKMPGDQRTLETYS
jgi:hypothetical protein